MKRVDEIKAEIACLAQLIGAHEKQLPTYEFSEQSGRPHIEIDERGYHYVVAERGSEFSRLTTQDLDELLYAVFQTVTHEMAFSYELRHRTEDQDCRRLGFPKQIELLGVVRNNWAERRSTEINRILNEHPFDDNSSARATLWKQLRDEGRAPDEIRQLAFDKYPPPEGWVPDPTGWIKRVPEKAT